MARYFDTFSTLQYNGQVARNLLNRAAITQDVIRATSMFYPYQALDGERADTLSFLYYKDPSLDWLVYFANEIVDPYYGWHLTNEEFNAYITNKYGSLAMAQLKVHHFEINWSGDSRQLTISAYEALPSVAPTNVKQYWRPVLNDYGNTIAYERKPMEKTIATNKIQTIGMGSTAGFILGELISQQSGSTVTGYAEIVMIETASITVKNVIGSFSTTEPVVGFESAVQQTPTSVVTLVDSIPQAEQSYWGSVSVYDYEEYLNNARRGLRLVDAAYAEAAENNLNVLMKS